MIRWIFRAKFGTLMAGLSGFFLLETRYPAREWTTARGERLLSHALLALLNSILLAILTRGALLLLAAKLEARGWGLMGVLGLPGPVSFLLSIAAYDCFTYWWHRANHRVPLLWRFHRVHHLDTHVDATTSLRFHPGELLLSEAVKALWLLAWGPGPYALAACEAAVTLAAQFHHANIDLPDAAERRLRPLVMTPRVHTAHHTVTERTRDANFATIASVWDRLFGTFAEPDAEESRSLGLPETPQNYLGPESLLLSPFQ
ncbi:MAG: sterol desaturase family protein [Elusimicrobia bacterium]|nr:sterol desaturase family protein [Elusimicrobiota bacterium]